MAEFDIGKYQSKGTHEYSLRFIDNGEEVNLQLKLRSLTWMKKNEILTSSMYWDNNGNTHLRLDQYIRECLKQIIVEAPWGQTNDLFLISLKDDTPFIEALKKLVPQAFSESEKKSEDISFLEKE